jgi:Spy/CpxP family protein refolding chaperone
MKNNILILMVGFLMLATQTTFAQPGHIKDRIQKARKEYVIKRLDLTQEQQKKFVPLYEDYTSKQHEIQKQIRFLRLETGSLALSDAEMNADIDKMIELKQKELDLEKEYIGKFRQILNVKQVVEMYKAERDFVRVVLKRLRDR